MTKIFLTVLLVFLFNIRGFSTEIIQKNTEEPCKYYIEELIRYAKKFRGIRYNRGGTKPSGFDCSGFVTYVFKKFQIPVERSSRDMFKSGMFISLGQTLPGDLIFFSRSSKSGSTISHVGIVIKSEDNRLKFIHSSSTHGVVISDLSEEYYAKRFKGIRRVQAIVSNFHFPYYPSFPGEETSKN